MHLFPVHVDDLGSVAKCSEVFLLYGLEIVFSSVLLHSKQLPYITYLVLMLVVL